jgi:hypothetical protein
MGRRCTVGVDRQPRKASGARRRRVVGLGLTAGTFLAVGTTPWFTAPAANADEFDAILDPILNPLSSIDPTLGADVGTLVSSFDPTFAADSAATSAVPAETPDFSELFNQFVCTPTHTALEDWINSNLGQQIDGLPLQRRGAHPPGHRGRHGHRLLVPRLLRV